MTWTWLKIVAGLTPTILSLIPGAAPLAPIVQVAIQTAEAIPGASSEQKLRHAQALVVAGAAAANAMHGSTLIDPTVAAHVAAEAINTIVDTTNIIHLAHAPAAAGV